MMLSEEIRNRGTYVNYNDTQIWAAKVAQLEEQLRLCNIDQANAEADNAALVDALEHCGYDPEDCIDCGGPPHNDTCRFWKLRHILSYWGDDDEASN